MKTANLKKVSNPRYIWYHHQGQFVDTGVTSEENEIVQNLLTHLNVDYGNAWNKVETFISFLRSKGDHVLIAKEFLRLLRETKRPIFKSIFLLSLFNKRQEKGGDLIVFHKWCRHIVRLLSEDDSLDISLYHKKFSKNPGTEKQNEDLRITFFGNSNIVMKAHGFCPLVDRLSQEESRIILNNEKLMKNISFWGQELYAGIYRFLFDDFMQEHQMKLAQELLVELENFTFNENNRLKPPLRTSKYITGVPKLYKPHIGLSSQLESASFVGALVPQIFYEGNRKCYAKHVLDRKAPVPEQIQSKIFDSFESFSTDEVTQKVMAIELLGHLKELLDDSNYSYWRSCLDHRIILHPVFAFCAYVGNVQIFEMLENYVSTCRKLNVAGGEIPMELLEVNDMMAAKHRIVHNSVSPGYFENGSRGSLPIEVETSNHFLFFSSPLIAAIVFGRSEMVEYLMNKLPKRTVAKVCSRAWMEKLFVVFREGPCQSHVIDYIHKYKKNKVDKNKNKQ